VIEIKLGFVSLFPKSAYSGNSAFGYCHLGNSNFDRIGGSIMPSFEKAKHATPNRITFKHIGRLDEPAPANGH
jgi:hypothetical protein